MPEGAEPTKHPWYATAVIETLAWVRTHGIGFFLLLLFVALVVWFGTRDQAEQAKELRKEIAALKEELRECRETGKIFADWFNKIINSGAKEGQSP